LSNDQAQFASAIGTQRSRALHSNHMEGHVWQEYGSNTLRSRPVDPNDPDPSDGGRGYYRSTTLLSIWSSAPFLHNNAVGPEICGKPTNKKNDFYYSTYVDANDQALPNPPPCLAYDPSVEGRFKLFKASMDDLLTPPEKRARKVTLLNEPIIIDPGAKFWDPGKKKFVPFRVVIPAGKPQAIVGNLLYKNLVVDLTLSLTDPAALRKKLGDEQSANEVRGMVDEFLKNITEPMNVLDKHQKLIKKYYMTSTDFVENAGHPFGTGLSDSEKKALTAFVATL
jgi:hypothetical protein